MKRLRGLALAALLGGCGGAGTQPQPDPFPPPDMASAVQGDMSQGNQPDLDPAPAADLAQATDMAVASSPDLSQPPQYDLSHPDLTPCPVGGSVQICGGVCTDLMTDQHNCGMCLNDCGTMTCTGGSCH